MKRILAKILLKAAHWLTPDCLFENAPQVVPLGVSIHISKSDVRKWRKDNPEAKSHRQALAKVIEEAKWQVAGCIGQLLMKRKDIRFDIKSTPYVADVTGHVYLYEEKED